MPALNKIDSNELYPMKPIKNVKDYQKALSSMEVVFDITCKLIDRFFAREKIILT
jgi:hypothetical protein